MDFLDSIKLYFFELGKEISELLSNIWKALTTKKSKIVVLCIILFITGCFVWKPLFLLSLTSIFMLMVTIFTMTIPIVLTTCCYITFYLDVLDGNFPKYPVLRRTVSIICSIAVFVFTTYLTYDMAIRDLWYQPELWSEILKLK